MTNTNFVQSINDLIGHKVTLVKGETIIAVCETYGKRNSNWQNPIGVQPKKKDNWNTD